MKVYLKKDHIGVNATGEFSMTDGSLTVLKGSVVSNDIAYSEKFKSSKSIERHRTGKVNGNVTILDVQFGSASTAANFVTGRSTNGLISWKDEHGVALKELVAGK